MQQSTDVIDEDVLIIDEPYECLLEDGKPVNFRISPRGYVEKCANISKNKLLCESNTTSNVEHLSGFNMCMKENSNDCGLSAKPPTECPKKNEQIINGKFYCEEFLKDDDSRQNLKDGSQESSVVLSSDDEFSESELSSCDKSDDHASGDSNNTPTVENSSGEENSSISLLSEMTQDVHLTSINKSDVIDNIDIKSEEKLNKLPNVDKEQDCIAISNECKDSLSSKEDGMDNTDIHESSESPNVSVINNSSAPQSSQLKDLIVKQVESYFCDDNLLKDTFLLRHVRRTTEGYVSLKLVSSFRKVKSLTKNWKEVAYSLQFSDKLEINSEGTKVRRKDPVPEADETATSRTVVVVNAPVEKSNVKSISQYFSKYGNVSRIRLLKTGKDTPRDIRRFLAIHPELIRTTSFCVEFGKREEACKVLNECTFNGKWQNAFVMALVVNRQKENGSNETKRQMKKKQPYHDEVTHFEEELKNERKQRSRLTKAEESGHVVYQERFPKQMPGSKNSSDDLNWRLRSPRCPAGRSTRNSECYVGENDVLKLSVGDNAGLPNQWEKRKYPSKETTLRASQNFFIPEGVIRLPKGPDGTCGFQRPSIQMNALSHY